MRDADGGRCCCGDRATHGQGPHARAAETMTPGWHRCCRTILHTPLLPNGRSLVTLRACSNLRWASQIYAGHWDPCLSKLTYVSHVV